jgi:RND family efflux transporter MFP subunit
MHSKRTHWSLVILLVAVAACSRGLAEPAPASPPPPPDVSVARVVKRSVQDWQDFTGRLEAKHSVQLRPRVSGHIEAVQFTEGARVKKHQVLFRIDPRPFREEVSRLEAELRRGESQLALAKINHERGTRLLAQGAAAAGDFDKLTSARSDAAANLDSLRAALAAARLNLEFTNVRAPIDGRASYALIQAGNLAQSDSVLTTIVSEDPIYAYFDVDEATYLRSTRGAGSISLQMGLSGEDGYPHQGKLDFVDNQVNPQTGTIRARGVFANAERRFTPGLFSRVRLVSNERFDALLVDDKALLTDQDRKYVYVLDESGKAQRRDVELGRMLGDLRIVRSGLSENERVIVSGIQKVFAPGMPVQATEVAMAESKAEGG